MNYHFQGEEKIESPSLVYYRDLIGDNIEKAVSMAGGPERLWPHVKTHKMAALVKMQIARGITRFKCAIITEAEMCAREGASDVLFAYPLVGPAISRFLSLRQRYPKTCFWAIGDNIGQLELLGKGALEQSAGPLDTLVDVNLGMNRTGVLLDGLEEFCLAAMKIKGLRLRGFHGYDGHLGITNFDERMAAVSDECVRFWAVKDSLAKQGMDVSVIVMGGTPTFPCHQKTPGVFLSPGTIFVNDSGYSSTLPDLDFTAAAAILTRVVSRPAPGLFTLDTGCKAISTDKPERGVIADLPLARQGPQSEEHWVWQAGDGPLPAVGDILYIIPKHICPTTALYPGVQVVSGGKLIDYWEVSARNRI